MRGVNGSFIRASWNDTDLVIPVLLCEYYYDLNYIILKIATFNVDANLLGVI